MVKYKRFEFSKYGQSYIVFLEAFWLDVRMLFSNMQHGRSQDRSWKIGEGNLNLA